jgi:Protein of unknown function (DUF4031)
MTMTVYVDDANIPATVTNGRARHTSAWCHLFADTQDELHLFAVRLGLRRSYFQPGPRRGDGTPSPYWHYDITARKRQRALRLGAQAVTWRQATQIIRDRETRAERVKMADQASHVAGLAFQAGDCAKASRLLDLARQADPAQASLWAERAARVHAAARAKAAEVAGPADPRPLDQILRARLEEAGITANDPALRFMHCWNSRHPAAGPALETQPGPPGSADSEPESHARHTGSAAQREAQS